MTKISKEILLGEYVNWLGRYEWEWFGTLTFRGQPSRTTAQLKFETWLHLLQQRRGVRGFSYVQVAERGATGNNIHFHVLVGGLRYGTQPGKWEQSWERLAGEAEIRDYSGDESGLFYILKTLLPDRDFDVHIEISDRMKKVRKL